MPSFSESIFLFILALLLFGPKKLPVLARELGKWVGEFRRASNEFKMQMEDELRQSEQVDRQKEIAAMEAAAPVVPPLPEPVHPHLPAESVAAHPDELSAADIHPSTSDAVVTQPLPIATAGELKIMPPATGLPTPQNGLENGNGHNALGSLLDSIPEAPAESSAPEATHVH